MNKTIDIKNIQWDPMMDFIKFKRRYGKKGRFRFETFLKWLDGDIRKNGIQKAPSVVEYEPGKFKVRSGNHRMEVLKNMGKTKIDCEVV